MKNKTQKLIKNVNVEDLKKQRRSGMYGADYEHLQKEKTNKLLIYLLLLLLLLFYQQGLYIICRVWKYLIGVWIEKENNCILFIGVLHWGIQKSPYNCLTGVALYEWSNKGVDNRNNLYSNFQNVKKNDTSKVKYTL